MYQNETMKLQMNNAGQLLIKTYFWESLYKLDVPLTVMNAIC